MYYLCVFLKSSHKLGYQGNYIYMYICVYCIYICYVYIYYVFIHIYTYVLIKKIQIWARIYPISILHVGINYYLPADD